MVSGTTQVLVHWDGLSLADASWRVPANLWRNILLWRERVMIRNRRKVEYNTPPGTISEYFKEIFHGNFKQSVD
ncbi:conserved hypothetical protein [Ricinus communis]|uniref:Chromo domain-containing protein n=1 Tax=Ricinus communis TaxID=3988 RepID=B9SUQ7_RICCO|nr:conserved hypothetical protein [Ricinus communis]